MTVIYEKTVAPEAAESGNRLPGRKRTGSTDEAQDDFGLYGQVNKCTRWMPWQSEAMKDVTACDKRRRGGK